MTPLVSKADTRTFSTARARSTISPRSSPRSQHQSAAGVEGTSTPSPLWCGNGRSRSIPFCSAKRRTEPSATTQLSPSAIAARARSAACGRTPCLRPNVRYRACRGMGARIPGWAFFKASSLLPLTLTPKPRDRLGYALDRDDFEPVDILLRQVRFGNDRAGEAQLGRFLQAFLTARRRAHLAREPDFAEHRELARQRLVDVRGEDGEQDRQVGGRLADTPAARALRQHR